MNMFARFDENPAMTLQDIKETKRFRRTHAHMDSVKTVYPPQTKFAGGGGGYKNELVTSRAILSLFASNSWHLNGDENRMTK